MNGTSDTAPRDVISAAPPLHGLRVVEFGESIAVSVAGMLLAEQGADVLKVEAPRGDPLRTLPAFEVWNRGKRIVTLDLKSDEGRLEAAALVAGADVALDGFRPGTLASFGVCFDPVERPDLITCSLTVTGDGSLDLDPADCDSALSALTAVYGHADRPVFNPLPIASSFAGLIAATSVAAAVLAREAGGRGQAIRVPILNAAVQAGGFRFLHVNRDQPVPVHRGPPAIAALGETYACSDGRWIQLKAAARPGRDFASSLVERLQELTGQTIPVGSEAEIAACLTETFLLYPAEFWETYLSAAGIACAVCRSVEEWIAHPHTRAAGLVVDVETAYGTMAQPGPLVVLAGQAADPRRGPVRVRPGDVSWPPRTAEAGPGVTRVLTGVRVLDTCILVAGPTCGRILAEFGADVIKIDSPRGGMNRAQWLDANRGKRSILVDLKSEGGREVMWRLVAGADVLVQNFRKGVMDGLGFGYAEVAERYPGIVYASINAYGHEGPFAERPGWEQLAQAVSGMQLRHGGRGRSPRIVAHAVTDYGAGIGAALGVLAALVRRRQTGRGEHVLTSLAAAAGLMQSLYMYDYEGYQRCEVEGRQAMGFSSLSRLYRAADSWLFLHCRPEQRALLEARLGLAPGLDDDELALAVAAAVAGRPRGEWLAAFGEAGIVAVPVRDPGDVTADSWLQGQGLIRRTETPGYGPVEHTGVIQTMSMAPPVMRRPAPMPGADTRQVLHDLGFTAREVGRLLKAGAVAGG